jgi:hypothetical protein
VTLEAGIRVAVPKNLFPLLIVILLPVGDLLALKIPLSSISESTVLEHNPGMPAVQERALYKLNGPGGVMKSKQESRQSNREPEGRSRPAGRGAHPAKGDLRRFMAGDLSRPEARAVVRHILSGCPACIRETRRIWSFGEERPQSVALPTREVGVWE